LNVAPDDISAGLEPEEEARPHTAFRSERHRHVAETLTLLARTARSFTLYDINNAAIRSFIDRLLQGFDAVLTADPEISLELSQFEMRWEGEAVYVDRDWERSLAFRLYRDGVRQLSFRCGFDWRDLAKLLEVLSIRYTGINQNEEDLVTLLWKADFEHLAIVAVRGFEPEEGSDVSRSGRGSRGDISLPDDIDIPINATPQPREPEWLEVSPDIVLTLRDQVSPEALPDDCLRLVAIIERELSEALEPMAFEEVEHVFGEILDYFMSEARLQPLLTLARRARALYDGPSPSWDPLRKEGVFRVISTFSSVRNLRRIIQNLPADDHRLPREVVAILDLTSPDPLALAADVLAAERSPSGRAFGRQLVEHYGQGRFDWVRECYEQSHGDVASDLLRVMSKLPGERNEVFFALQASNPEIEAQDEALHHLERMPYSGAIGRWVFDAYRKADAVRRQRLLAIMERSQDRRFVDLLADFVQERAESLSLAEAVNVGMVMGRLGLAEVLDRCDEWLKTSGLIRKTLSGPIARQVAAVAALGEVKGEVADEILDDTARAAGAELRLMVEEIRKKRVKR
jgi:hypothetical protein